MIDRKKIILLVTIVFIFLGITRIFYLETMEHDPFGTLGSVMYGVVKWLQ